MRAERRREPAAARPACATTTAPQSRRTPTTAGEPARRASRRKGIYILPNAITLAALFARLLRAS